MCLTEEGKVFAWGGTLHKKTGETSGMPKNEPRLVQTLADKGADALFAVHGKTYEVNIFP